MVKIIIVAKEIVFNCLHVRNNSFLKMRNFVNEDAELQRRRCGTSLTKMRNFEKYHPDE